MPFLERKSSGISDRMQSASNYITFPCFRALAVEEIMLDEEDEADVPPIMWMENPALSATM